jgi:hypothetical protein
MKCFMKTLFIAIFAFLFVGCATSSRQNPPLTADQAKALAVQLANDKATALYHCEPFMGTQPAQFISGHWFWTEQDAYGHADIEAAVTLAANGSTNHVQLTLFYSESPIMLYRRMRNN